MWFGTQSGLLRYDGQNYKVYRHNPHNPQSLSSDKVVGLAEDSMKVLWIATHNGLDRYDKYHERIERMIDTVNMSPIRYMLNDQDGKIWLGTYMDGLAVFDKESKRMISDFQYEPTVTTRIWEMHKLLMDRDGTLWIYSDGPRFWGYNPGTTLFEEIADVPCEVGDMLEDRSGRIWITSACGLYIFDRESKRFTRQLHQPMNPNRLNTDKVCSIMEDSNGNLWIATYDGVYKYTPDLRLQYCWPYSEPYSHTVSYSSIHGLSYEDHSGTIWIFNRGGICKLRKEHNNFTILNPDPPESNENRAVCLLNADTLLYGASTGYYVYDRRINSVSSFNLLNSPCRSIYKDSHGVLWFGTLNGLYKRILSDDNAVEHIAYHHIPGDSSSLPGNNVNTLFEDSSGRLWIGCQFAMPCYYDRENNCFVHLLNDPGSPIPSSHEPNIFNETSDNALIASAHGAFKIFPPFTRISEYSIRAKDVIEIIPVFPLPNKLSATYESFLDSRGTIWLGSLNLGLFKWEEENMPGKQSGGTWTLFTTLDGLSGNTVKHIEEDLSGNLWIGTTTGLSRLDPVSETFTNFYEKNGLPSNVFLNSGERGHQGELYFGSGNGMISFHPDSIVLNTTVPPVRITSFKVHNQEVTPGEGSILSMSIQYTDAVKLSHKQNTITLNFAVLNYIEPERNQYKYMLEGLEDDWVFSGLQNNVTYAGLKPGKYTFSAKGSNNDGIWNEEGVKLSITVLSPPWYSWWAYTGYVFLLLGIVLFIRRNLVNRAKMKTRLLEERIEHEKVRELDHMKSRFFANISHEFRTPLTLILGPVETQMKLRGLKAGFQGNELDVIHRNAKRLLQLINQLLDISKMETGTIKLQVSEGNLSEFIRRIVLSYLSLAESEGIRFEYILPDIPGPVYFDEDKLEKIITNLASNAFKFTPSGGEIKIHLKCPMGNDRDTPARAEILIQDTGKGIPPDQIGKIFDRFYQVSSADTRQYEGTGIGLSLTKELVDIYRGEIRVESEPEKGSRFTLVLPISKEEFKAEEIIPTGSMEKDARKSRPEPNEGIMADDKRVDHAQPYEPDPEMPVVLIIEDNADLRNYISQNLRNEYRVVEAENGKEGLVKAIEEIPDLIITDLMMPEIDGIELCKQIKNDLRTDHIPVVILTARADKKSKYKGLTSGADDYQVKPFDADELQIRVSNLILQRRKLRERYQKEVSEQDLFAKDILTRNNDFLNRVVGCILENLEDHRFGVEQLAKSIGFSRSQLQRKVYSMTGYVPNSLIRNIRLSQAALMFQKGNTNITRVLYRVGFNTPSHFSKCFRELYGVNPSEYISKRGTKSTG